MLLSTCKLSVERGACWRFAELSDRPTSLICRVPAIALNQRRTHLSTLPRQTNSEFTVFRGGRDLCFHPSTRVAIAIRENTFLPANVRRIYTPPAQLAGRGGATEAGQRRRGFSNHELIPMGCQVDVSGRRRSFTSRYLDSRFSGKPAEALRLKCFEPQSLRQSRFRPCFTLEF